MAATVADNSFVKSLADSSTTLKSVPANFTFAIDSRGSYSDSIPIIDFSLLASSCADQRAKVLRQLAQACEEWGFFVLVNHGIPESVLKGILKASLEFFELPEEEKRGYDADTATVVDGANQRINLWRDYVKYNVHPDFHCPDKPQSLRDIVCEYSERTRSLFKALMSAIGENLGLQQELIDQTLGLDKCYQLYVANYYPPCPQPDQSTGIPAHTDPGLITFLINNGVAGLQIQHRGEWFDATSPSNSILVNTADHLEVLSNGRYKSVMHRAVLNMDSTRTSVVMSQGPAADAVVVPAPKLVEQDGRPFYRPMKFIEYVETMLTKRLQAKTSLDCLKIEYP